MSSWSLLEALAGPSSAFVLFARGVRVSGDGDDGIEPPEEYVVLQAFHSHGRANGRLAIFRVAPGDLDLYDTLFGSGDALRGVATERSFEELLERLSLREPVPSTVPAAVLGPSSFAPLIAVLRESRFFFEEIGNSTQLRVVSRQISAADVQRSIDDIRRLG